jgi:hypothetical protein
VVIASGTVVAGRAGKQTLSLTLTSGGRSALRATHGGASLTVTATVTPKGASSVSRTAGAHIQ